MDRDGHEIAADYKEWLTAECRTANGDTRAVYEKHKDSGMRLVETAGDTAVIVASDSTEPDGFLKIEISAEKEIAERLLFGHWLPPEDLQNLLHPSECAADPIELSPRRGFTFCGETAQVAGLEG